VYYLQEFYFRSVQSSAIFKYKLANSYGQIMLITDK